MRTRPNILAIVLRGLLLSLSALLVISDGSPSHSISTFENLPARFLFFDDTDTAIFHDAMEGNIYVSLDEGKTWQLADDIPRGQASMFYEHPADNRYGFVLTDGKTHYRTEDQGKTWRPFNVPVEPAFIANPLSFHSDPKKYGYILYQGMSCEKQGWGSVCHDETYYTKEAFSDDLKLLRKDTSRCQFAHSSPEFKHEANENLIYCTAFDASSSTSRHDLSSSRLFSSEDFFQSEKIEDFGIGKNAKGIIAFAIVSKFGVVALKDLSHPNGDLHLYVTVDTKNWARAHFPHASSARLRENAYTLLESTTHSLAVDVVLRDSSPVGTLFVSNSNGTYFVESLKDTNRNPFGYVDYERIYGLEGIGIANTVSNVQEFETGRGQSKKLKSYITFDDGSNWALITPPAKDVDGDKISCDPTDTENCSLHFHSVTNPHNFGRVFSSPSPGFVMGVGSTGRSLKEYKECDTFLSTDGGVTWRMASKGAHKYQFGDLGSILLLVNDEELIDHVKYSLDLGKSWLTYKFGMSIRARGLTTLPDSTSQKFLLLGQVAKNDRKEWGRVVVIRLDFSATRGRKCGDNDFEKWYARQQKSECLMGHKQWYKRRKPDANCYVGEKFNNPVVREDRCECTDIDFECDYNYVRNGDKCEPVGPEPIPAGVCADPEQSYMGSSGWRKIPGNNCEGGLKKDEKIRKKCSQAQPAEGAVIHQTFDFKTSIIQHSYFKDSKTILVRLADLSVWQSSNEGYSWTEPIPSGRFMVFYHHKYSSDRAFLITDSEKYYYTTDTGRNWHEAKAPTPPNFLGAMVLHFHPTSDLLIWTGNKDCGGNSPNCRAEAQFSRDNGRKWTFVEHYVRNCAFAKDHSINADPTEIICESFKEKSGNQRFFSGANLMELVVGSNYYQNKKKIFDAVVGFAKFSEYLIVAEFLPERRSLSLQVSLDGVHFATGQFPPSMHPETHAYTILESSTDSLFIHMTMSEPPAPYWGNLLKSNSNGTYFGIALENVNRNDRGFVDFEKMIGLDGIALVNIVSNPGEAQVSGEKTLQTRITHNDGGTWTPLNPPTLDSLGNQYECQGTKCQLHVHGYTERRDPRTTYSSPSIKGLLMAVGNVGEKLVSYTDSDTFLSRDAGFTWEEVHKDAHMWEFGDSGSILIMVNDEQPTTFILFSTDEGLNWREYQFTDRPMRVNSIVTVPMDTSRKFLLFGDLAGSPGSSAVHIDLSSLTSRKCEINIEDPGKDDFELWSPSEGRPERCLFGRQTLYHRRVRNATCIVGDQPKAADRVVENCSCTKFDFECEFNHVKDSDDNCVLVPGTVPLGNDESCKDGSEFWYERTAYRKIPYSSCEDGYRPDRGTAHICPGFKSKGALFWIFMLLLPFGVTALIAYYYYRRSGFARGIIRLPGDTRSPYEESGVLATIASVPWFVIGVAGIAYEWVTSRVDSQLFHSRRGYRDVPIDEDAQILRFEDEE